MQVQINHVLKKSDEDSALTASAKLVSEACQEVRRIAHDMMPGSLIKIGLFAALADLIDTYAGSTDITFHYDLPDHEFVIADKKAISIYRSIQEIINNLIKYAEAKNFYLNIEMNDGSLQILAEDDGVGFDNSKSDFGAGLGLQGIKSRIENLGGTCQIYSRPGEGVRFELIVPDIEYR